MCSSYFMTGNTFYDIICVCIVCELFQKQFCNWAWNLRAQWTDLLPRFRRKFIGPCNLRKLTVFFVQYWIRIVNAASKSSTVLLSLVNILIININHIFIEKYDAYPIRWAIKKINSCRICCVLILQADEKLRPVEPTKASALLVTHISCGC